MCPKYSVVMELLEKAVQIKGKGFMNMYNMRGSSFCCIRGGDKMNTSV
jgi:hypothetical protein